MQSVPETTRCLQKACDVVRHESGCPRRSSIGWGVEEKLHLPPRYYSAGFVLRSSATISGIPSPVVDRLRNNGAEGLRPTALGAKEDRQDLPRTVWAAWQETRLLPNTELVCSTSGHRGGPLKARRSSARRRASGQKVEMLQEPMTAWDPVVRQWGVVSRSFNRPAILEWDASNQRAKKVTYQHAGIYFEKRRHRCGVLEHSYVENKITCGTQPGLNVESEYRAGTALTEGPENPSVGCALGVMSRRSPGEIAGRANQRPASVGRARERVQAAYRSPSAPRVAGIDYVPGKRHRNGPTVQRAS